MKRKALVLVIGALACGLFSLNARAQASSTNERDLTRRMQDMRALEGYARRLGDKDQKIADSMQTPEVDKATREKIKQMRAINPTDVARYRSFLNDQKTGIFKLFPDIGCVTKNVIRVDGECTSFVPESADFSFRTIAYTHPYYHDLALKNGEFVSKGFFSEAFLVSLGDVPIEGVTAASRGIRYLSDLEPGNSVAAVRETLVQLKLGIDHDGYHYSNATTPAKDTTYGLRVSAFRIANTLPPVAAGISMMELKFLSLARDKRDDILIVFRVIRKDDNGGLTIVWKELARKEAAKLKFRKDEPLDDLD